MSAQLGLTGAVATSSGARALLLALHATGVTVGAEVIVPTYVCESVAAAVRAVGARPVYADIAAGWQGDVRAVARAVTSRTAAIILVHHLGVRTEAAPFVQLGLPVIEDFCQTFDPEGHAWQGEAAVFSFHATKCLTTGEGGMVAARRPAARERLRALQRQMPFGSPMSDLQAALGLAQLARYGEFRSRRRAIADRYFAALPESLTQEFRSVRDRSMGYRFLLTGLPVEAVADIATRHGVVIRRGVDALLHRRDGLADDDFPVATALFSSTASIPAHPSLSEDEVERVVACIVEASIAQRPGP